MTPSENHLFEVNEKRKKLDDNEREIFHHFVAKALFLTNHPRRDLQTTVAFLCMRVKSPGQDDRNKLVRMIRYLRETRVLKLTLEENDMHIVKWWVDSAHGLHPNMRGHTGQMMILVSEGWRDVYYGSSKQKIDTKISTETELLGASDALPQVLWIQYFIEHQGYNIKDNEFNQ